MTIFRVPGDFPSVAVAVDSPLVKAGDTILVEDRACDEAVVVPADKFGLRITTDEDNIMSHGGVDAVDDDQGDDIPDTMENNDSEAEEPDLVEPGVAPPLDTDPDNDPEDRMVNTLPWLGTSDDIDLLPTEDQAEHGGPVEEDLSGAVDSVDASLEELPENRPEEHKAYFTVSAGMPRMFKPATGSPYWVVVHRHK